MISKDDGKSSPGEECIFLQKQFIQFQQNGTQEIQKQIITYF